MVSGGEGIGVVLATLSTVSVRGVVKKSVPRVPTGALGSSMSWSLSFGLLTGNSIGVAELVALGRTRDVGVEGVEGCSLGSLRRDTSSRSAGFVPRPGKSTRVAPFEQEPTAIPKSPVWLYLPGLGLGGIADTGHPKGNLNLELMSGTLPVTISCGDKGRLSHSFWCGRQLEVSIQCSTA